MIPLICLDISFLMTIVTLAPAEDGGEKTKTTGRGQQVHHGYPH